MGVPAGRYPQGKGEGRWRRVFFDLNNVFNHVCLNMRDLRTFINNRHRNNLMFGAKCRFMIMDINIHLVPVP